MADIHQYEPLWGEWYCLRPLGHGSYGTVYLARKEEMGQTYLSAIKHIPIPKDDPAPGYGYHSQYIEDGLSAQEQYRQVLNDLLNEIQVNNQLKGNANIASYEEHKVYERPNGAGYDVFIKMELLTSLTDYLQRTPFTLGDVLRLGENLCSALTALQREKILHRDIKPSNVLLHSSSGQFKLCDFGVSRVMDGALGSMTIVGTPIYMAPEALRGERADYRMDLYSLGMLLYRLLNDNRGPFLPPPPEATTAQQAELAQQMRQEGTPFPPPRQADQVLASFVLRACAFRPEDRWESAAVFRQALLEYHQSRSPEELARVVLDLSAPGGEGQPSPHSFRPGPSTTGRMGTGSLRPASFAVEEGATSFRSASTVEDDATSFRPASTVEDDATSFRPVSTVEDDATSFRPASTVEDDATSFRPAPHSAPETGPNDTVLLKPSSRRKPPKRDVVSHSGPSKPAKGKGRKGGIPLLVGGAAVLLLGGSLLVFALTGREPPPSASSPAPTLTVSPSPTAPAFPDTPATLLADAGIRGAVCQLLGISEGDSLSPQALEAIEELRIPAGSGHTVGSLEDLYLFPNLNVLDLSGQQIADLTPVANLTGLTALNLAGCPCADGSFLRALSQLVNLDLSGTGLQSLDFAAALHALVYLDVSDNLVEDLTPLAGLTQLTTLVADGNPITDWTPAAHIAQVSGPPPAVTPTPEPAPSPAASSRPTPRPSQTPVPTPPPTPTPTPTPAPIPVTGLTLSQGNAILESGARLKLTATVQPSNADDQTVSWSSSNSAVLTVDQSGNVLAVGPGTATVTASCGGYTASCVISVA